MLKGKLIVHQGKQLQEKHNEKNTCDKYSVISPVFFRWNSLFVTKLLRVGQGIPIICIKPFLVFNFKNNAHLYFTDSYLPAGAKELMKNTSNNFPLANLAFDLANYSKPVTAEVG